MDSRLARVLEATGFLHNGEPAAPSVALAPLDSTSENPVEPMRLPSFRPNAWWRTNCEPSSGGDIGLRVYFKFVEEPADAPIVDWQREIWNQGFAPLLWVVSPARIDLYNGFGVPLGTEDANRIRTFRMVDQELETLDSFAGRLAMETGQVWGHMPEVDRSTGVDERLLGQLGALERLLEQDGLDKSDAQALVGRSVFAQYLVDGGVVDNEGLEQITGHSTLPRVFGDRDATIRLFDWLRRKFNGDMFQSGPVPAAPHLERVGEFLAGTDPATGQTSFFPYQFDVIPVELISAIYEQFVHSPSRSSTARREGVFYTPLTAVSLVLDEVLEGCDGDQTVLDLTCGSGVFLVEALRRLVRARAKGGLPSREVIRDVLHRQIHGVDINEEAVRIAAFSLYLAALEMDPDPHEPAGLKFKPLIGHTLLVGDAFEIEPRVHRFDVIVGNPPWTFKGARGTERRRARRNVGVASPRGESLDFLDRALDFAHDETRLGMIVSATPFFSRSSSGILAARAIVERLKPVTLVNLSSLADWLFPNAKMPAMAVFMGGPTDGQDEMVLVNAPWSPTGRRSRLIEISTCDIATLPLAAWKRNRDLFKATFVGHRHDLLLLDDLVAHVPLGQQLTQLGAPLRNGLIFGDRSRDASHLHGFSIVRRGVDHFRLPANLSAFSETRAQWPRQRVTYDGPLVLVAENLHGGPRPVTVVAEEGLVFTDSYHGVSFRDRPIEIAYLLAGILASALASWYFLMSGSAFGVWKRRLKQADIAALPMPDLVAAVATSQGRTVQEVAASMHQGPNGTHDWNLLDEAVFDLYRLDQCDRIVVRDGHLRAGWQWEKGRRRAVEAVADSDLCHYARVFLSTMDDWLAGRGARRMRAEVLRLKPHAPLRVVRFVLEDAPGPSVRIDMVRTEGPLGTVLDSIGEKARVRITQALVGVRDLRVHAENEVSIIKPAASRNWLCVNALEDADAVVEDSFLELRTTV